MSEIRSQATPADGSLETEHYQLFNLIENTISAVIESAGPEDEYWEAASAVLKAGWSKPRTVNSAAELDALPRRSVVMDTDEEGHVWIRGRKGLWHCSCDSDEYAWESADMFEEVGGKFTVLFTPGGE